MARIISFAWTAPALISGNKSVTRRQWSPGYARRFTPGDLATAYDRNPRNGGKPIATLRILSVSHEPDADAPDSDYEAEGFAFFEAHPELLPKRDHFAYLGACRRHFFERWRQAGGSSWVVRFEKVGD